MTDIVSREKLDAYGVLLRHWSGTINLIAPSTIPQLQSRHIEDSMQLIQWIGSDVQTILDIGSGGGLPIVPIALSYADKICVAVESDRRKCAFLQHVVAMLDIRNLHIREQRMETITDIQADLVTARACSSVDNLLALSVGVRHKESRCLFLKGRQYETEIETAERHWHFDYQLHPSRTEESARIVEIFNIQPRM